MIRSPALPRRTHVPFCGEGVRRGLRVLVTQGGVPVSTRQENIPAVRVRTGTAGRRLPYDQDHQARESLQTVTGTAPCPSFEFHQEFGGASDTFQLKDGTYRVKVFLSGVKKSKVVRVNMDQCTFTQNVLWRSDRVAQTRQRAAASFTRGRPHFRRAYQNRRFHFARGGGLLLSRALV